jgi:hypothetical protein
MSSSPASRYSTRELRAAAAALDGGEFASRVTTTFDSAERATRSVRAMSHGPTAPAWGERIHSGRSLPIVTSESGPPRSATAGAARSVVRVRAAHPGAGASTVALALADGAAEQGIRTRILDAASPEWSGLAGTTSTELGAAEGWRRGRRSPRVLIDRVETRTRVPAEVPLPRAIDGVDLDVLDEGWTRREIAGEMSPWFATMSSHADILVTRSSGSALAHAGAALAELGDIGAHSAVVVVIGPAGSLRGVYGAGGDLLRAADERGALVFVPLIATRVLGSLNPDPLPKQLMKASRRLLAAVTTTAGPLTSARPDVN